MLSLMALDRRSFLSLAPLAALAAFFRRDSVSDAEYMRENPRVEETPDDVIYRISPSEDSFVEMLRREELPVDQRYGIRVEPVENVLAGVTEPRSGDYMRWWRWYNGEIRLERER